MHSRWAATLLAEKLRKPLELIAGPTAELTVQAEPEQVRVVLRLPVIKAR